MFSISPTDVWAAGDAATVIHWDGSSWTGTSGLMEGTIAGSSTTNTATFYTVWASGPGDIWLAGTTGNTPVLMRGDGTHWNLVSVATSGNNLKRFTGIWGTGPNDVWVGGWQNGALYHWDGAGWTRFVYADDGTTFIEYVAGVAKNDLYIGTSGYLTHFNGSTFTDVTSVSDALYGVWATPGAGVWASADGVGRLWHLVGSTWVSYQIPNGYDVTALWGDSATSLWVAGHYRVTTTTATLWRFDGTWTMIPQAASAGARAISGPTNQSDAIAVGAWGQIDLLTGKTSVENPGAAGVTYDVQATSSSNVWLAGGPNLRATHWDGASFTDYTMGGSGSLTAVGVSPGGDVWTATSNVSYKFDGTHFVAQTGPSGVTPNSFWAPQSDSIWVTTGTNAVYNWTGSAWQPIAHALVGSSATFRAVWGATPSNVWLVGGAGITQHYDGANWTPTTTPDTTGDLMGVWGWDSTHVLTTSSKGVVYSWDGQEWTQSYSLTGGFGRIHGCAQNDVWAVRSDASRIEHYDGANWSESATGLEVSAAAIWCASPGDAWVVGSVSSVGSGGAVLRRQ